MKRISANIETPNGYLFWSYGFAIASVMASADAYAGDPLKQSISQGYVEYVLPMLAAIVTFGGLIKEGPPGLKFVRACSYHKL